jgi:hypothetical protein
MSLNTSRITRSSAFAIVLLGSAFVSTASADCAAKGGPTAGLVRPQSWSGQARDQALLLPVADDRRADDRIVGFWRVKLVSEGSVGIPDGTLIDDGLAQWHSDGTEVTNSLFAPATGNICFGVWQRVGPAGYTLNHFGFGFDANGVFLGLSQIREHVIVDHGGQRFEGTFSIDQFDVAGNRVARIVGRAIGTRITVQTSIQQLL